MRSWEQLEQTGELAGMEWGYVAGADACPVGQRLHGQRLASLAAVYEHLPGFGENPACERRPCACTALPSRIREPG